jgi:hypothetical protein
VGEAQPRRSNPVLTSWLSGLPRRGFAAPRNDETARCVLASGDAPNFEMYSRDVRGAERRRARIDASRVSRTRQRPVGPGRYANRRSARLSTQPVFTGSCACGGYCLQPGNGRDFSPIHHRTPGLSAKRPVSPIRPGLSDKLSRRCRPPAALGLSPEDIPSCRCDDIEPDIGIYVKEYFQHASSLRGAAARSAERRRGNPESEKKELDCFVAASPLLAMTFRTGHSGAR